MTKGSTVVYAPDPELTIASALRETAQKRPEQMALRAYGEEDSITWGTLVDRVDALAGGLREIGVQSGSTVGLMLGNRPEFHLADLAVVTAGGVPFSIYQTLPAEQVAYILRDADARVVVTERNFLDTVLGACAEAEVGVAQVIVVDGIDAAGGSGVALLSLEDVEGLGSGFDGSAAAAAVRPDDLLTIIYTSGTTGPPKGVQLLHRNIVAAVACSRAVAGLPEGGRSLSWLPAAHIAERHAHHYLPVVYGFSITSCGKLADLIPALAEVRPHWFFAVPRVWEKFKARLESEAQSQPEVREEIFAAVAAGTEKVRRQQAGEAVPAELEALVAAADERHFDGWRRMLGLHEAHAVNTGAAPIPVEVVEFFHAIGVPVAEMWGLSETCGCGSINRIGDVRIGTVGPASPGAAVRLAADGEVLVRGPMVMAGYRNRPEETREVLDDDGWLSTGDIGQLDDDGFLTIVDRKKEIIINSAGKNMSPANIEARLKSAHSLIGQVCCIGDARPFNTALIVLDAELAPLWAREKGLAETDLASLADDPVVVAEIERGVEAANAQLARVEQIKAFTIVPGDWSPGGIELTPTMKLKRRPIADKYADTIDAMYERAVSSWAPGRG